MRWTPGKRSSNLEDRRGQRIGLGGLGMGGTVILLVLGLIFGRDFLSLAGGGAGTTTTTTDVPLETTPEEERLVDFVSFVLDQAQNTWAGLIPGYRPARLVLFRDGVQSACGFAQSATGPFYCPADEKVYVDLGFFDELRSRFGAPGDFAQAYVLAHEIGHHVQNLTGTMNRTAGGRAGNEMSVRVELQADCYAGIWGARAAGEDLLETGDVEEGMGAAAAVGDDRLQRMSTGRVSPETWTHGSSDQRVAWFKRGLSSGRVEDCDTFAAR